MPSLKWNFAAGLDCPPELDDDPSVWTENDSGYEPESESGDSDSWSDASELGVDSDCAIGRCMPLSSDEKLFEAAVRLVLHYLNNGNGCEALTLVNRRARAWCDEVGYCYGYWGCDALSVLWEYPDFLNFDVPSWERMRLAMPGEAPTEAKDAKHYDGDYTDFWGSALLVTQPARTYIVGKVDLRLQQLAQRDRDADFGSQSSEETREPIPAKSLPWWPLLMFLPEIMTRFAKFKAEDIVNARSFDDDEEPLPWEARWTIFAELEDESTD